MSTNPIRLLGGAVATALLLAACGGTSGSTWTIAPVQPTPTARPSGAPSAVPSQAPSAAASGAPSSPSGTAPTGSPAASGDSTPATGQTIKLTLTGSLSITEAGEPVGSLSVHEGETVHFVIDNVAGFPHNFFIGPADELAQNQTADLSGIPDWPGGVKELDYVVTADTANLQFACTLPGHYPTMHGTFKVES